MQRALAIIKAILVTVWLFILMWPTLICFLLCWKTARQWFIRLFYRGALCLWNVRVKTKGVLGRCPLLLVANHTNYLDVLILGSMAPFSFVSKAEVKRWPVVGKIAQMCDVVFIERRPGKTAEQRDEMREKLEGGAILCFFPEGTTSDGVTLLPFKSAFFSLAETPVKDMLLPVQPASIAYTHLNGVPVGPEHREIVGWLGDAPFMKHLMGLLRVRRIDVTVRFHPVFTMAQFEDRKAMAAECQRIIQGDLKK